MKRESSLVAVMCGNSVPTCLDIAVFYAVLSLHKSCQIIALDKWHNQARHVDITVYLPDIASLFSLKTSTRHGMFGSKL